MARTYWTDQDIAHLKLNFSKDTKENLINKFNRTWPSIVQKARSYKIKRPHFTIGNMYNLLNNSLESFYWLGFLLADGHFSKTGRIQLRIKDEDHLRKFSVFMGNTSIKKVKIKGSYYYFTDIQNPECMNNIRIKYDISNNKTLNPCNIKSWSLSVKKLVCLIIGFIDGDGFIVKRVDRGFRGGIKIHANWLGQLIYLNSKLVQFFNTGDKHIPYINNNGYAQCNFSARLLIEVRRFITNYNLPVLYRKWNRVIFNKRTYGMPKFYFHPSRNYRRLKLN